MNFMPLQTLQLKENSGGPAEGPLPGGTGGSIHWHNTGIPRRYCDSDHHNKERITTEQILVFLLVEGLALNL